MLDTIQRYIDPDKSNGDSVSFKLPDLLQDPLLNSALSETLRLQMNGLAPRKVMQDTTLMVAGQYYAVHKGDVVFISMPNVHKNPEVYEYPDEFRLDRFLPMHNSGESDHKSKQAVMKNGARLRNPYIWWGGGQHMVNFGFGMC